MKSIPIFNAGNNDLYAINPDQVRFLRSMGDGVRVVFDNDHSVYLPDTLENVALQLWHSTVGPAQDTQS